MNWSGLFHLVWHLVISNVVDNGKLSVAKSKGDSSASPLCGFARNDTSCQIISTLRFKNALRSFPFSKP